MRVSDWEQRLNDYLASQQEAEFVWGQQDCAMFAAGAVEAITGSDPIPEFRGSYSTEKQAAAALRKHGGGTFRKTLDSKFESIPPSFAQRGDLAFYEDAVGVVIGSSALFFDRDGPGLVRIHRSEWVAAWRV